MINVFNRKYKNLKRYREVLSVFYKYGFDSYISGVGEKNIIRRWIFKSKKLVDENMSRGERLKRAIEELGPTFVKLGQILSTRYDMLPRDIVESLSGLQDSVNEFSLSEAQNIFKSETGKEFGDAFAEFCEEPIAAASIGQVYRAKMADGQRVVIKVQRPNIEKTIKIDIDILSNMARLVDESLNKGGMLKASEVVKEFGYYLNKEIDYTYEAQNALKFANNFKNRRGVKIPKIYWEYTTCKVLVMEEIEGIKISEVEALEQKHWNLRKIAKNLADSFMTQVFIDGIFHGDPHPGNIMVIDENTIGYIDFGITGFMDNATKRFMISMLKSSQDKNVDDVMDSLMEIGSAPEDVNEEDLKKDIYFIMSHYFDMPMDRINIGDAIKEVFNTAYNHKLKLPTQLSLLMKATMTIEGSVRKLEPGFSLEEISKSTIGKLYREKISARKFVSDTGKFLFDSYETISKMPKRINKILENTEKNKLKLNINYENEEKLIEGIKDITRGLVFGTVTGALILGSSILIFKGGESYGKLIKYASMFTFAGSLLVGNLYMWSYIIKKK